MIINSFLDNDLYKFTMGQLIYFNSDLQKMVTYKLINRDKSINLGKILDIDELQKNINHLLSLKPTEEELKYLANIKAKSFYNPEERNIFISEYIEFLSKEIGNNNVNYKLAVTDDELVLELIGNWKYAVYYEVPLMAIISESYTKALESRLSNRGKILHHSEQWKIQEELIEEIKKCRSLRFSDFGTRRRYSFDTQERMIYNLNYFHSLGNYQFSGTSNLFFAKKYNIKPIGTMAHELFMGASGLFEFDKAYSVITEKWKKLYGDSLSILLPDTFTSDWLFDKYPKEVLEWEGIRHDSGDPIRFGEKYIELCEKNKIDPKNKVIVFSDSLDINKAISILEHFRNRVWVTFGIGTKLTNNTAFLPLNIVVKLVEINNNSVVKLSDDPGKNTGDSDVIKKYLKYFLGGK
ncbi:nicotinate phosphoribosyltransferase [Candidatus Pacearchaeota archaeon]|nr:nicotinate phosphoribosyltransferase [Candidatus Pacearchaeota archaeon]